ncbi:MAG: ATPase [Anaerolineaceae bacterium]|nr:ATPase [Anaerolineaceae bacterium]
MRQNNPQTNQVYRHDKPTIGVLAGWQFYRTATNLSYLAPIYRGISRAAQDLGCNLLLGCGIGPSASPTDPLRPAWPFISTDHDFVPIGPWNTDGLIIANPLHSQTRTEYVKEFVKHGHPTLFIGLGETGSKIVIDNEGGIHEAIYHLIGHGHKQIAFIAGSPMDLMGDTGERLRAYQSARDNYNLDGNPDLIAYGNHVFSGGYDAMMKIIKTGAKFSAVLASNDESALGAMKALSEVGLRVPQDIAVIGFDNRLDGAIHKPGLTSIHVPLFSIGYRAVELLFHHLEEGISLPEIVKINARLVVRESCGCGIQKISSTSNKFEKSSHFLSSDKKTSELAQNIAESIINQTYNLTEDECYAFSEQLVNSFTKTIYSGDRQEFHNTLTRLLDRVVSGDDDTHIWQVAISLLEKNWGAVSFSSSFSSNLVNEILSDARLVISAHLQHHHQQYVINERWTTSRLSLLTARLLNVLDESQIYEILATHLPDLDIHTAMLVLFESDGENPIAWSILRNVLDVEQNPIRFKTQEFPPSEIIEESQPFILTLIPILTPTKQIGFVGFGVENFDLYGSIVQQLGGAFNSTRLYQQANSERQRAEEADRLKSRFLSTISHELRTPLNLIVGLSGILLDESAEEKLLLPEPVQRDVERINAYAQHLGGLIGDVLDLANRDAGQLRLNMELIDLSATLRMVIDSGAQLTTDKGLSWKANLPETGPWVWGDSTRLRQVVLNFINNAVKFTAEGEISLFVEAGINTVSVRVCDTGLGIRPEDQAVIFGEFRRLESSISRGYPGLGLGLAISKILIEMHDGTIGVESTGLEGEGSCFYFNLPTVQPPAKQISNEHNQSVSQQTVMVLLTHENTCANLCDLLTYTGINVQKFMMERKKEWQTMLVKSPPDAIILDVSIQSEMGWNTLKGIKSNHLAIGIPIMFYSSSPNGEGILNLDYLTKPIDLSDLTQTFDHVRLMIDSEQPVINYLIVDDNPDAVEMLARVVQSQSSSYRVLKAQNGNIALDILKQEKVDVVLLDLQMPVMDGFEVLEFMRSNERTRDIPVIVVTGKLLTESDMDRINQGVTTVLNKGMFSLKETAAHISSALDRKRNLSQAAQRLVRQAMAFIQEHYAEQITRKDIAQYVNISEDYLTFCFRQEMAITPIKYIQRFRINQAKQLIKTSQKSITEIAFLVGFTDSGYFSRIFHRETGMSPEDFRSSG